MLTLLGLGFLLGLRHAFEPDHADAYFTRGMAKYELKDFTGAIADYTAAINLDPNLETASIARGRAFTALRNEKPAKVDLNKARDLRNKFTKASSTH